MAKLHFISDMSNQIVLFPQRLDERIAENGPVHLINSLIDNIDLSCFYKLYKEEGRSPYHPRVMLKAVLYAFPKKRSQIPAMAARRITVLWKSTA